MKALTSWRTTIGGLLAGIGTPLALSGEGIYKTIGTILATLGTLILGFSARDHVVSSEDANIKPKE